MRLALGQRVVVIGAAITLLVVAIFPFSRLDIEAYPRPRVAEDRGTSAEDRPGRQIRPEVSTVLLHFSDTAGSLSHGMNRSRHRSGSMAASSSWLSPASWSTCHTRPPRPLPPVLVIPFPRAWAARLRHSMVRASHIPLRRIRVRRSPPSWHGRMLRIIPSRRP